MLTRLFFPSLISMFVCLGAETARVQAVPPEASATVTEANYCFVKKRGILSEQMPTPTLTLQLKVRVSFNNPGGQPLILPIDHDRTVFIAMAPGVMKAIKKPVHLMEPKINIMAHLPADVSPANPIDPKNNVFSIVRAGGATPLYEEVVELPIYRKTSRGLTDLRGKRIYLKLQLEHQAMTPGLIASLSDRWARFGVPWTGILRTNMFVLDVPTAPQAVECSDK
jgi:hypothetical protein